TPERVIRGRAVILRAVPGQTPTERIGVVHFTQRNGVLMIRGRVRGLSPGLHGTHVHESGDLGNGCLAAGAHFNPTNMVHGGPTDAIRHVGDLGNIAAGADGVSDIDITDRVLQLTGSNGAVGRAFVIHSDVDDLGRGGAPTSNTTGNSGSRVACGVVRLV
ncbi:copper/zinc superoxide dismutase, partial [Necator americanus]